MRRWIQITFITLAIALNAAILSGVVYVLVSYMIKPSDVPLGLWIIPLGLATTGGSIWAGFKVYYQVCNQSDEKLNAWAWGAISALIAPLFSALVMLLFIPLMFMSCFGALLGSIAIFAAGSLISPIITLYLKDRKSHVHIENAGVSRLAIVSLIIAILEAGLLVTYLITSWIESPIQTIFWEEYLPILLSPSALALVLAITAIIQISHRHPSLKGRRIANIGISLAILEVIFLIGIMWMQQSDMSTIKLVRISDGKVIRTLRARTTFAAFSSDGTLLAAVHHGAVTGASSIKLWNVDDGKLTGKLRAHTDYLNKGIVFSTDGSLLAAGGDKLSIWQLKDRKLVKSFGPKISEIRPIGFLPDGRLLSSQDSGNVVGIWQISKGRLLQHWKPNWPEPSSGSFAYEAGFSLSSNGKFLAGVRNTSEFSGEPAPVYIWRTENGELISNIKQKKKNDNSGLGTYIALSPDGDFLAIARNEITLWQTADGKFIRNLNAGKADSFSSKTNAVSIVFSPDGSLLATGGLHTWIWRLPEGKLVSKLEGSSYVTISPDNKFLALVTKPSAH